MFRKEIVQTKKILVCGYYFRNNFGDDAFVKVFQGIFSHLQNKSKLPLLVEYGNIEEISEKQARSADLVVLGGGDLLQSYFMKKVEERILPFFKGPIYAIGAAMPFDSVLETGQLDCIDKFWVRFRSNADLLAKRYGSENVHYIPDLAFLTPTPKHHSLMDAADDLWHSLAPSFLKRKRVGICLARSMVRISGSSTNTVNSVVVENIREMIRSLVSEHKCDVYWIAFNTDSAAHESDLDLYKLVGENIPVYFTSTNRKWDLSKRGNPKVGVIDGVTAEGELMDGLVDMDVLICSRFHAHVFGYLAGVPVVSLALSRKIHELNVQYGVDHNEINLVERKCEFCSDKTRETASSDSCSKTRETASSSVACEACEKYMGYPTSLPVKAIVEKVVDILNCGRAHKESSRLVDAIKAEIPYLEKSLLKVFSEPFHQRSSAPFAVTSALIKSKVTFLRERVIARLEDDDCSADYAASLICLDICGNSEHPFRFGLAQALEKSTFDFEERVEYMLRTFYQTEGRWGLKLLSNPGGRISLSAVYQNCLSGHHRSGWSYVLDHLKPFHNAEGGILFDSFLDRTFGWESKRLFDLGQIPYRQAWTGFFHHPMKAVFSDNDCEHVFQNHFFLESLKSCRGLWVMSRTLQAQIQVKLANLNVGRHIPVFFIHHPTEFSAKTFNLPAFFANPSKLLVHVGAWLRDPFAIYKVRAGSEELGLKKAILKGKNMDHYVLNESDLFTLENGGSVPSQGSGCRDSISTSTPVRVSLANHLKTVKIIERLDNDQYDTLLSENVIFLPLLEAVAVNTLIECIVRNTPVVVPRLPAVVDYLGKDYPLYMDPTKDYADVDGLLDRTKIEAAHRYLVKMDKSFLLVSQFAKMFEGFLRYL